jgi:hypothetical protein
VSTRLAGLLAVEGLAYAGASTVHSGVVIKGDVSTPATIAEGTIAVVLLIGAALIATRPDWTRNVALGVQAFALAGTLFGFTINLLIPEALVADLAFHVVMGTVLVGGLVAAASHRPWVASTTN